MQKSVLAIHISLSSNVYVMCVHQLPAAVYTHMKRRVGELASWRVGELSCWRVGMLASWHVGELACWRVVAEDAPHIRIVLYAL